MGPRATCRLGKQYQMSCISPPPPPPPPLPSPPLPPPPLLQSSLNVCSTGL
ncbi:hypothetical protein I79_012408 [Cricetulus griseus]|uniref:Uncharacterized protein n=1 Tax=Cricetulus griseus TaxID=10029 RepID=G3HNR5_CRIGR|nr:hypothetical protein I79_012408 [Cricetulus griseus]